MPDGETFDDPNVDTCYKGDCYCGENRGAPCVNTTNTCSGGICKCGTLDACTGKTVDTCTKDTKTGLAKCTCGGASECSGQTDTCTEGKPLIANICAIWSISF